MIWFLTRFYQGMSAQQIIAKQTAIFQEWSESLEGLAPVSNPTLRDLYQAADRAERRVMVTKMLEPLTAAVAPLYSQLYELHRSLWADLLVMPYEDWIDFLSHLVGNVQQAQNIITRLQQEFVYQFNKDVTIEESSTLVMDHSETPKS